MFDMNILLNLSRMKLNGIQRRILDVVWSQTNWTESAEIPLSLVSNHTGIRKDYVAKEMALLIESNIIVIVRDETNISPRVIKFNSDYSTWLPINHLQQKKIKKFFEGVEKNMDSDFDDFSCQRLSEGHDHIEYECRDAWAALYIAIYWPIQITPEEAARAIKKEKWRTKALPVENQLTTDIIMQAKKMILDKPHITAEELEQRTRVNRYTLIDGMKRRVKA